MKRLSPLFSLLALFTLACAALSIPTARTATSAPQITEKTPLSNSQNTRLPVLDNSALVDVYDPARNPAQDLQQAILIAKSEKKRILLELGGDWCSWCKFMDEFYATHSDILQFRADHYVLVKVNVSDQNMNEEFLSQFPAAAGYPHVYILDSDGTFLHSQDTVELEDGKDSYVPEVFRTFLQKWALPD